jgi:2-methylcitrate dehydratase PrpD
VSGSNGSRLKPEMSEFTRRRLLRDAMAIVGALAAGAVPYLAFARQRGDANAGGAVADNTLALARTVNAMRYEDLPARAVEHAKMILASTLSSAAPGALIDSARILRDLAKERGGRPEATVWFDAARLPAVSAARVNAGLSDAAASDDSDIRNTAHYGTTLASAGLAIAERTGATGKDLLGAMVIGYEAAGRIGDARRGGRGGLHASQLVAFGGAVAVARLLKLSNQQMAHALGIVATTMGGLAIGTNS